MLPKPLLDALEVTNEPTPLDRLEYTVRRLEARVLALEQAHSMSIEELQQEVIDRYKLHTRNVGVHIV